MKKIILTLVAGATLATAAQAANFDNNAEAIHYRQSAFGIIAHNFGDMAAMLKGKKPFDQQVFEQRAANVAALAAIPAEGFIPGSDKGETEALSKIWQDKGDFDAIMKKFQKASAELAIAAKSGDKKAIKMAFKNTAKNCKGCHDSYKKD